MGKMKQKIEQLNNDYTAKSVEKMKELCAIAGVAYRSPAESRDLVQDLVDHGKMIRISQYNKPDVRVGQKMVLRTDGGDFIAGAEVWIDLKEYEVNAMDFAEEADIQLTGTVH